jgi:hypothetical protein
MEALAREPLAPPDQAERIKALRRDWQALGPVTQAADGRLADRFNGAADHAFETCRAYFAEQAERRQANLAECTRICDQLERYLDETDWHQADMKAAERILRAAREEWRRHQPLERNPGKAVHQRFEALQGRLHQRVKAEWDRNLAAKQAIVAEAEALVAADRPVREKAAAAKALQQRWREVGITPRRPDQRLWRAFRAACDQIFSAREHARQQADAELADLETHCRSRLEAFETLLEGRTAADASPAELRELENDLAALERLPEGRRRALTRRRDDAVTRYRALLAERQRAQQREALLVLQRWDENLDADPAAAAQALPPPPFRAMAQAVAAERTRRGTDAQVSREALRRLTVRAELAAGLDSPPDDEALRLEVQVQRLQDGLAGGGAADDVRTLAEAWCRLGPKGADAAGLRERFFGALTALG